MKSLFFRIGWVCVFLLVTVAPAMADGDSRPATAVEKNYELKVLKGFEKAMPKGPEGWTETERTEVKAPERMGVGAMGPLRVYYGARWEDQAARAASNEKLMKESQSIPMPDQAAMDAMNAEMESLGQKMAEAAQKGDMATIQKLQQEADAITQKHQKTFAPMDARMREIQQSMPTDISIAIRFEANNFEQTLYNVTRQSPVSGLTVYRVEEKEGEGEPRPGTSYVFLGDWQPRDQGEYLLIRAEARADIPPASVQTIMVTVRGDDARARKMLDAVDWSSLKGLLGK